MKNLNKFLLLLVVAVLYGCDQATVVDHAHDQKQTFSAADRKAKEGR